jgi:hypothetical protein
MLGVAPHVAEAVLNHLPAKLIRTYDRTLIQPRNVTRWGGGLIILPSQSHRPAEPT